MAPRGCSRRRVSSHWWLRATRRPLATCSAAFRACAIAGQTTGASSSRMGACRIQPHRDRTDAPAAAGSRAVKSSRTKTRGRLTIRWAEARRAQTQPRQRQRQSRRRAGRIKRPYCKRTLACEATKRRRIRRSLPWCSHTATARRSCCSRATSTRCCHSRFKALLRCSAGQWLHEMMRWCSFAHTPRERYYITDVWQEQEGGDEHEIGNVRWKFRFEVSVS